MRGPHAFHALRTACLFCNRKIEDKTKFESCPEAPDFEILPKPTQIWRSTGEHSALMVVTYVASNGDYKLGGQGHASSIYSFRGQTEKPLPVFPPPGYVLYHDSKFNPWLPSGNRPETPVEDDNMDRMGLLMEDDS